MESRPEVIAPEDRKNAQEILKQIGTKFAEVRGRGKSAAWEDYQRLIASNLDTLVLGGAISLKEASQLLMQVEEFRKGSSENGKTPGMLLADWLSGELAEDVLPLR